MSAGSARALQLTDEQQRQLKAGEIVTLDVTPPGASPMARGGTALAVVPAPVERVWAVLVDYQGHPRYYPRVTRAEVVEVTEGRALVRYVIKVGPFTSTFHMIKTPDVKQHRIDWHLAEGQSQGLLRENTGYWRVEPRAGGSLVTYAIAVRTILPDFFTGGSERDSLTETIAGLRRVVIGSAANEPARR
jgi:uncharacterized protein YndB with AHSA1/START domain